MFDIESNRTEKDLGTKNKSPVLKYGALSFIGEIPHCKWVTVSTWLESSFSDLPTSEKWIALTCDATGCGIPCRVQSVFHAPWQMKVNDLRMRTTADETAATNR